MYVCVQPAGSYAPGEDKFDIGASELGLLFCVAGAGMVVFQVSCQANQSSFDSLKIAL